MFGRHLKPVGKFTGDLKFIGGIDGVGDGTIVEDYLRHKGELRREHSLLARANAAGAPTTLIEKRFAYIREQLMNVVSQWKNYYVISMGQGNSPDEATKAANHIFDAAFIAASAAAESILPLGMMSGVKDMKMASNISTPEAITQAAAAAAAAMKNP
jgi:hypothetical protein